MRNQLISIFFTGAILVQLFLDYPLRVPVSAILCVGCFSYFFWVQQNILRSNTQAAVSAKRIRRRSSSFILLLFLLVLMSFLAKSDANRWIVLFSIASVGAIEIISFFQYRNHQPATLLISGNRILLDDFVPVKRDLSTLNSLLYNASTETISLHFEQQHPMHLVRTEFEEEGLRNILSHALLVTQKPVWTDERIRHLIKKV